MNLLRDTHTLIWFLLGNRRLSHTARRAIENTRNRALVSALSGCEVAIKCIEGKIDFTVLDTLSAALRSSRICRSAWLTQARRANRRGTTAIPGIDC